MSVKISQLPAATSIVASDLIPIAHGASVTQSICFGILCDSIIASEPYTCVSGSIKPKSGNSVNIGGSSVISGGVNNNICNTSPYSFIGSGNINKISSPFNNIVGGSNNCIFDIQPTIDEFCYGYESYNIPFGFIGNGCCNSIIATFSNTDASTITNGCCNTISDRIDVSLNPIKPNGDPLAYIKNSSIHSNITNGLCNSICTKKAITCTDFAHIGNGEKNCITTASGYYTSNKYSSIVNGCCNVATTFSAYSNNSYNTILNGIKNTTNGYLTFVGSGSGNTSNGCLTYIGNGISNYSSGCLTYVGTGNGNSIIKNDYIVKSFTLDGCLEPEYTSNYTIDISQKNNLITGVIASGYNNIVCSNYGSICNFSIINGCNNIIHTYNDCFTADVYAKTIQDGGGLGLCNCVSYNNYTCLNYLNITNGSNNRICNTINNSVSGVCLAYANITNGSNNIIGFSSASDTTRNCNNFSYIGNGANNCILAVGNTNSAYNSILNGKNNSIISGNYTTILGGSGNYIAGSAVNAFVLGSNITANASNYTFVNNISSQGFVYGNRLAIGNPSAAAVGGSSTCKFAIYSQNGNLIGYVPIYPS